MTITIQAEKQFKDLVDSYSRTAIQWAIQKNIISGYEDGTFRPRNNVSEAEWLAMMAKYYKEDIKSEGNVSGTHWANQIYKVMEKHKLPVKGTSNSKARDIATKSDSPIYTLPSLSPRISVLDNLSATGTLFI